MIVNKISNRQAMSDTLLKLAKEDPSILVLTSDSRGSALLQKFYDELIEQYVEVGIAEQNIVGIASGLAHSGKKPFVVSPASFLSMRSIEQIKVDVAYSNTNVKLIGISGGVSYGALGMSHHSLQDIAVTRAIPNLQVLIPSDRFETQNMIEALSKSETPAYLRIGRNAVEDVYENLDYEFQIGKAVQLKTGKQATIFSTGEMVKPSMDAADLLSKSGISVSVVNIHTLKPLDTESIIKNATETKLIVSVEEHSIHGGLGSAIAETLSQHTDICHVILGIPDEPAVTGNSQEVFNHYGLTAEGIAEVVVSKLDE